MGIELLELLTWTNRPRTMTLKPQLWFTDCKPFEKSCQHIAHAVRWMKRNVTVHTLLSVSGGLTLGCLFIHYRKASCLEIQTVCLIDIVYQLGQSFAIYGIIFKKPEMFLSSALLLLVTCFTINIWWRCLSVKDSVSQKTAREGCHLYLQVRGTA